MTDPSIVEPVGLDRYSFYPDSARVMRMDRIKHADFCSSLNYIAEQASPHSQSVTTSLQQASLRLSAGEKFPPLAFGAYFALVEALTEGNLGRAEALAAQLATMPERHSELVIKPLMDPAASLEGQLFVEHMTSNAGFDMSLLPPDDKAAILFEKRLQKAFRLLDKAIPELGAEVKALAREVVLAVSDPRSMMQFDGGSHYKLWGAVFLNVRFHPTVESVVEVLAHESAHNLLFGYCNKEPLVYNDDDQLFHSPLRKDPRPMDGVYHATFVLARMHYAMSRLLESGLHAPEREQDLIEARDRDKMYFFDGYTVVEKDAILTDTGRHLMKGACEYMAQFA